MKLKRIMAIVLSFAMVLSTMSFNVFAAEPSISGDIINVDASNAQDVLDGKYGSISGKTINFTENITEVLDLARPTKYSGSETVYECSNGNSHSDESKTFTDVAEFLAHYGENEWHTTPNYYRTLKDVTFTANEGVIVTGFTFNAGHIYGECYDYVREKEYTSGSAYNKYSSLENITFDGLTVTGQFDAKLYQQGATVKNVVFDGCTFTGTTDVGNNAAIKFLADSQYFTDVTVKNCSIDGYYQGVYISGIDGASVINNNISNTVHNAIALQSCDGDNPAKGTIVVKENYITNVSNRAIRMNYVGDADIAINNNIMVNCGDSAGQLIAAVSVDDAADVNLEANYWDGKDVSTAVPGFTAPTTVGVTGGTWDIDVSDYVADGFKLDADGSVVESAPTELVVTTAQDLKTAISEAEPGATIGLGDDIYYGNDTVLIDKSLTINGNGHKIISAATRVIRVTAADIEVTLNGVNVVSNAVRVGQDDIRGISVDPETNGVILTLDDCSVDFTDDSANDWAYAVNQSGTASYGNTIKINGGSYEGANVINIWGDGHSVIVEGATLTSLYAANDLYSGVCVNLEGENTTATVKNTTFLGDNAVATESKKTTSKFVEENNTDKTQRYVEETPAGTIVATVNGVECADASAMISALNSASGEVTVEIYGEVVTGGFGLNNSNIEKLSFVGKTDDAEICVDGVSYIDVRYTRYPVEYTGLILSHINAGQNIDGYLPQYFSTYNGDNVTYTECTFPNGVTACGSVAGTTYTFNECIFNNTTKGLYSLWIYGNSTNVVVNGGEFCGVRGIKMYSEGSNDFSSLSVSDATFSDTITEKHAVVLTKGESVTLTDNTFNNTTGTVQVDDDYASLIDGKTVTIDGTEYIVNGDSFTLEESTPAVTVATVNGEPYTSLQAALDAAAAGEGNVTVEILSSVDLTGVDWNPVLVSAPKYPVVTVNGNDKTITGLNDMLFSGTWAGGSGLIINDLTIKDSKIEHDVEDSAGNIPVGAFVGYPQASAVVTLNNCHLLDSTVSGGHWTGGLVGASAGYSGTDGPVFLTLTISNCSVKGSTITGKGSVGGIIGHGTQSAWTQVNITDTIVFDNDIISTGSSTNKAGSIMGTIGAAGTATETNGVTKTGGISVDAQTSENEVTSGGATITTIYGRLGTEGGKLSVAGGTYEANPIEENVSYAAPAEGYEIKENADGTWGVEAAKVASITDNGTTTYYPSLDAALEAATSGQTVELVADEITVDTIVIPSGVIVKMNGGKFTANKVTNNGEFNVYGESTLNITTSSGSSIDFYNGAVISDTNIGGTVTVISKITFLGDNVFGMLNDYGAAYSGSDPGASWTVEPGATVTLTNAGRYGLGYGDNTIIKGTLSDALTARETLTAEDASFFTNGVALMCSWDEDNYLSVENAYVILGSNNSFGTKADYGKKGKFHISFNNAVMDSSRITNDAAAGTADFTFNKSDIKVGAWSDKSTASTVKFTDSKMLVTGNGTDWNNENAGSMTLENTDIVFESGAFTNSGNITLDINSSIVTPQLSGAGTITIDAEGFDPEQEIVLVQADMSGFTGTISVTNNSAAAYKIEDGKIILVKATPAVTYVAYIGDVGYETVQDAINDAKKDDTVVICAGEYSPINISGKNITIQGTVGDNGELLTTIKGGDPAITGHSFNGTIKDIKIVDAWKAMYAEPAGNVTVDNVYVTGATYGFHLIAYSTGLTWTIQNSYMDLRWANSFGVSDGGDADIIIRGNEFDATNPYYQGGDVYSVNSYLPSVTVEENIFRENTRISIDGSITDTSKINVSKNYHADGVENAFDDDPDCVTVPVYQYYRAVDENGNLTDLVDVTPLPEVASVNGTNYPTLAAAIEAAKSGDDVVLLASCSIAAEEEFTLSGVKLTAAEGVVLTVAGKLTIDGGSLTDVSIDGTGTVIFNDIVNFYGDNAVIPTKIDGSPFELIVNKDATLLISRFVLGYNRGITVYGNIEDAHEFDPTDKTPSLKFNSPSGVSVGGTDNGKLIVKDAYIELGNSSWKDSAATHEWSFENSYVSAVSFGNNNLPYNETASWTVTFDDSVLNAKNYIKTGPNVTYNFTNNTVATTGSLRNDGVINIDETSSVTTTSQQNNVVGAVDEHGGNNGTVNVSGTLTIGSNSKTAFEMLGGTLNVNGGVINLGNNSLTLDASSKLSSSGDINGEIVAAPEAEVKLTGGTYTHDVSEFDADGYAALPDLNGNYVVGTEPTATVKNLGAMTIPSNEYYIYDGKLTTGTEDMPLNFVMQFVADQDADDMKTSPFANWYADFVITFEGIEDGSFDPAGCYLAGYYGSTDSWDGLWVKIPVGGLLESIDEGTRYPVMMGVGMPQTYDYVCSGVEAFSCAMFIPENILEANPNLKVNLELNVVDSSDDEAALAALQSGNNIHNVSETTYEASDFEIKYVAEIDGKKYVTLADAFAEAKAGDTITILDNIEADNMIKVNCNVALDLNGKTITGTDNATGSFALIEVQPGVEFTVDDTSEDKSGKITLAATNDRSTGSYSAVISNQRGKLTVNNGTIEHLGGTYMAYGIDNLTNGKGTYAETIINGGTIKSTYRAIRQFLNGTESDNILTVNGGTVEGANRAIWMQDPNANANTGKLTVTEDAVLNGDVFLSVTEGSTEWPVEVSIAKSAVNGKVETNGKEPNGYALKVNADGYYTVVEETPELKNIILGGNVDLESSLAINFFIDPKLVVDTDVVVIEHVHADGSVTTVRQTISECRNNAASGYPRAKIDSIAAKEMADAIKVTVYNAQGDQISNEITYSIRDYAMTQLGMTKDTELKTVLVDMLNYGATAQQYFNYNIGDYANSLLTEEQKALATTEYVATKDGQIVGTNAAGMTISLESSIMLSAFFTKNVDSTVGMYATAKFIDHYGEEKTQEISSFRNVSDDYIVVDVTSLAVADMNQFVEITLYNADGSVYGSFTTSVGSYVVDNSNNTAAVALAKFATSAKNYFSKH